MIVVPLSKTLQQLSDRAHVNQLSMLKTVEKICDNHISDIKPSVRQKLANFVKVVQELRRFSSEVCFFWTKIPTDWSETGWQGMSPPDLIRKLLQRIDYQQYLRRTQSDWDSRWQNVEELITFASEIKTVDIQDGDVSMEQYVLPWILVSVVPWLEEYRQTPLRLFLQASMLSSEGDSQNEASNNEASILPPLTSFE